MRDFLNKVARRLKMIFVKVAYYNQSYKPTGVYDTVKDYVKGAKRKNAKYHELYAAHTSTSNITQEFLAKCSEYLNFPVSAELPTALVVEVPEGRIHTDTIYSVAIISHDNKLIGEVSYQMNKTNPGNNNIFQQNYFITPKYYKGVAFHTLIGGSGSNNYFHWLFDSLARIHLLKKGGLFNKVDWFIVPSSKLGYQRDSLKMLGIDQNKIIEGDSETHIQTDLLLASSHVRHHQHMPEWVIDFLREHYLTPETVTTEDTTPYIYISRKDSNKRRLLNEPELLDMLDEYGFKSVELASLTFQEQINLFYHVKIIVAPHGAGLANLVFCKQGATVIEMFSEGYVLPIYYDLANKVGVSYEYLVCKTDASAISVKKGMKLNMTVDLDEMRQKIYNLIAYKPAQSAGY